MLGISDRNGYSPSRYTVSGTKRVKKSNDELPSFFKTTTINPVVLNETSDDPNHSKVSSFANTAVNSSSNSQQFSLTSSPSLRRKAVLSKNEGNVMKSNISFQFAEHLHILPCHDYMQLKASMFKWALYAKIAM